MARLFSLWWGQDLNLQPSGYEPDELPIAPPHDVNVVKCNKTPIKSKLLLYSFSIHIVSAYLDKVQPPVVPFGRENHAL